MADLSDSFKSVVSGLDFLSNTNQKFVMAFDKTGNTLGKTRPEAILLKNDLVDMGLPSGTLWATKNVGAATETDYGWYFSWGNINMHMQGAGYNFSNATYATTTGSTLSGDIQLENDAANANLGSGWHIPTSSQFAELFDTSYTTNEWVTNYNGVSELNGLLVTSKTNTNKLFFPAAGNMNGTVLNNRGSYGIYWSSSLHSSARGYNLRFNASDVNPANNSNRFAGLSLRPVM